MTSRPTSIRIILSFLVLVAGLASGQASAAPIKSAYTKIKIETCTTISEHELGATWKCPGFAGVPVFVAESDLRFFVSYGANGTEERAFQVTPPNFNSINETLEWRYETREGKRVPFATILRFFIDREGQNKRGQVLIVTRLGTNSTCHIAYIDARTTKKANALARDIADTRSRTFDCEQEPSIHGAPDADAVNFWETTIR